MSGVNVTVFQKDISNYKKIALDTCCFVYAFEGNPFYIDLAGYIFTSAELGKVSLSSSILVLTELLVPFQKRNQKAVIRRYIQIFRYFPNLTLINIEHAEAVKASYLRGKHPFLRTPDALHLACALAAHAEVFVTNDKRFIGIDEGISILCLDRYVNRQERR